MRKFAAVQLLFQLGLELADHERATEYAGISSIASISSSVFLEHGTELSEDERYELLRALVKRRAAREGLINPQTELSAKENNAIGFYLKHDNSIHGLRPIAHTASCKLEEDFDSGVLKIDLASKDQISSAIIGELASKYPAADVKHSWRDIQWVLPVRGKLNLFGMVDLSTEREQATSLLVLCEGKRGLHAQTSFLGVLGLGTTSWRFLPRGREALCATQTVEFFSRALEMFRDTEHSALE